MRISKRDFGWFLCVLAIEIFIGLKVHDRFVRPFVGDVLVVVLLYFLVRAFFDLPPVRTALAVFAFACAVEVAQYFQLAAQLGLDPHSALGVMVGRSFDPMDFVAYATGALCIVAGHRWLRRRRS